MSKFNIKENTFNGRVHIGDVYSNASEFLKKHNQLHFTETEKELVEIIFANTASQEEQIQILESLKAIRDEGMPEPEKSNARVLLLHFTEKLVKLGQNVYVELFTNFLSDHVSTN